jgi:2-dehydropantoate 2-reductase
LEEVEAVARASEIELPAVCVEQPMIQAAAVEPWASSSLYHDLARGGRLELESLNCEPVRRGHEYCVETPLNFAIYAALRPYVNDAPALP